MSGAIARIILRYGVGIVLGALGVAYAPDLGERLARDPDLVLAVTALIGFGIERFYVLAKRKGWKL